MEIFKKNNCLIKLRNENGNSSSCDDNIECARFYNHYSISSPGSYVKSSLEDLNNIDSIIIFDPMFRIPVEIINGRIDVKINSTQYFRINLSGQTFDSKRIKLMKMNFSNYKIIPPKNDF